MKRLISILLVAIISVLLVSCQSTPEKPVVIQKDLEQMIEKAQATDTAQETQDTVVNTLAERLNVPGRFIADESYSGGQLTLTADAQIVLPRVDRLPVVRVEPADFSQELVDKLYDYLIGDTSMYQQQAKPTKEKIQENLILWQQILNDPESTEESKLQAEEQIAELEAAYPAASDSVDLVPADAKIGVADRISSGYGREDVGIRWRQYCEKPRPECVRRQNLLCEEQQQGRGDHH